MLNSRIANIVVAEQRLAARSPRGRRHCLGIRECQRHRLLTVDVLAGGERSDGYFFVKSVRRRDRNEIHMRIGYEGVPIRRPALKSKLGRFGGRVSGIDITKEHELRRGTSPNTAFTTP